VTNNPFRKAFNHNPVLRRPDIPAQTVLREEYNKAGLISRVLVRRAQNSGYKGIIVFLMDAKNKYHLTTQSDYRYYHHTYDN